MARKTKITTMDSNRTQFLYNSITDISNTIKSIDAKLGFMMAILIFPLTNLGKIYQSLSSLYPDDMGAFFIALYWIYIGIFSFSWTLSFLTAIRGISSISDPSRHIRNNMNCRGTFYCAGQFNFDISNSVLNPKNSFSKNDLKEFFQELPDSIGEIDSELAYEQMKLSFIRDLKICRQKWSFSFAIIWLVTGFIGYIFSLVIRG